MFIATTISDPEFLRQATLAVFLQIVDVFATSVEHKFDAVNAWERGHIGRMYLPGVRYLQQCISLSVNCFTQLETLPARVLRTRAGLAGAMFPPRWNTVVTS